MSKLLSPGRGRVAIQICAMTAVAALMSGCSADSTRFGDAFGNPFATGSIAKPKHVAVRRPPSTGTGHSAPVVATALPARGTPVAHATPVRTAPVAVSHETTGSIAPARTVPGASFGGWSVQGGASIEVAQGDTAPVLAQRYGVPENVLLQVNGLHAAADVHPGSRIVIPIYNAVASAPAAAPRIAQATPRAEPAQTLREPVREAAPAHVAKAEAHPAPQRVAEAAPAAPARKGAAAPAKMAAEASRAEHAAEAKAAAEKAAAAKRDAKAKADKAAAEDHEAKAKAVKAAAEDRAAKAKLARTDAAKPAVKPEVAPKVAIAVPAKPDPAPAVEPKKPVDTMPTASVPPAAADAPASSAGTPEFRWPARGRIIAGFKGGAGGNDGINIAVPDGTPVKAAEGGVVAYAGSELKGYGNLVLIKHPNGYVTAYANNGEIDVKRGETVKRGQTIAKSGQSGNVSSPQLHFELRKGSQPVDPTSYLAGL